MHLDEGEFESFAEYLYSFVFKITAIKIIGMLSTFSALAGGPTIGSLRKINLLERSKISKRCKFEQSIPHDQFHYVVEFAVFHVFIN